MQTAWPEERSRAERLSDTAIRQCSPAAFGSWLREAKPPAADLYIPLAIFEHLCAMQREIGSWSAALRFRYELHRENDTPAQHMRRLLIDYNDIYKEIMGREPKSAIVEHTILPSIKAQMLAEELQDAVKIDAIWNCASSPRQRRKRMSDAIIKWVRNLWKRLREQLRDGESDSLLE